MLQTVAGLSTYTRSLCAQWVRRTHRNAARNSAFCTGKPGTAPAGKATTTHRVRQLLSWQRTSFLSPCTPKAPSWAPVRAYGAGVLPCVARFLNGVDIVRVPTLPMRLLSAAVTTTLAWVLCCTPPVGGLRPGAPARDAPSAVVRDGPVVGDWVEDVSPRVARFRGIPFAASTAGVNRWAPPVPPEAWGPAPLDATSFGFACVQVPSPGDPDGAHYRAVHLVGA